MHKAPNAIVLSDVSRNQNTVFIYIYIYELGVRYWVAFCGGGGGGAA